MIHDASLREQLCENLDVSFLVRAPAGSGKTHLLITRYLKAMILADNPQKVIALTFTQKAAQEMKDRLYSMLFETQSKFSEGLQVYIDRIKLAAQNNPNHWIYHPQSWMIMTIDAYFYKLYIRFCDHSKSGKTQLVLSPDEHYSRLAQSFICYLIDNHAQRFSVIAQHYHYKMSIVKKSFAYLLSVRERWFLSQRLEQESQPTWPAIFAQEISFFFEKISRATIDDFLSFVLCYHPIYHKAPENAFEACWLIARICLTEKGEIRKTLRTAQGFVGEKNLSPWHTALLRDHAWNCFLEIQSLANTHPLVRNFLSILQQVDPSAPPALLSEHFNDLVKLLFAWYEVEKQQTDQIDFIDLSENILRLFDHGLMKTDFDIYCQKNIQYFFIDEAQDLSWTQSHFMKMLLKTMEYSPDKSFFIVGDPQQAIYYFRGSDVSVFEDLSSFEVAGLTKRNVTLTQNFRSQPALVRFVNQWALDHFGDTSSFLFGVDRAIESFPHQQADQGRSLFYTSYESVDQEAYQIAHTIQTLLQSDPNQSIGILARDRASLKPIVQALEYFKIPFSSSKLYMISDHQLFHDLCIGQKLLDHPSERMFWIEFLRSRWIRATFHDIDLVFQSSEESFWKAIAHSCLSVVCQKDLHPWFEYEENYRTFGHRRSAKDRLWHLYLALKMNDAFSEKEQEAAEYILQAFESFEGEWKALDEWARQTSFPVDADEKKVTLSTIHKAKGLEFDAVFLPNLGARLPIHDAPIAVFIKTQKTVLAAVSVDSSQRSYYEVLWEMQKMHHDYEAQRLLYVALTRAKKQLYLSYSQHNIHKRSFLSSLELYFDLQEQSQTPWVVPRSLCKKMHEKSSVFFQSSQADHLLSFNQEAWTWTESDERSQEKVLGQVIHKILEKYLEISQFNSTQREELWQTLWRQMGGQKAHSQDGALKWALWQTQLQSCRVFQSIMEERSHITYQELNLSYWSASKKKVEHLRVDKVLQLSQDRYWIVDWKIFFSNHDVERICYQLAQYKKLLASLWKAHIDIGIYVISHQKYYSLEDLNQIFLKQQG